MSPELQTIERAFACQPLAHVLSQVALLAQQILAPAHRGQQRVEPQLIMVVDVLVAQRDALDALAQHDGPMALDEPVIKP